MKGDYKIPTDIYERVHELLVDLVNASAADDDVLHTVHYEQLREFCEEQTAAGRGSGFMWEALADVTDDLAGQMVYYERALEFARRNSEPIQRVSLEIGRMHAEAGDWLRALPHLILARQEAIESNDEDTEGEAAVLMLQAPDDDA